MKLYNFWRSTAAYRVRIALNLKGLTLEEEHVDLFEGQQHSPEFRAVNPQGMIPALALDNGTVLTQSLPIIDYLDAIHPEPLITPLEPVLRARVQAAAYAVAIDIHPLATLAVSSWVDEVRAGHRAQWVLDVMARRLPAVETLLAANAGPYAFGDQVTLADICLVAQLYNAKAFEMDLSPYPRLMDIDAACMELAAFKDAEPKAPDA